MKVLYETIWSAEGVPQEFNYASTVHLYKRNGNRQCCYNHRGIFLLSIAGEILARVLLNRLLVYLEHGLLPEKYTWKGSLVRNIYLLVKDTFMRDVSMPNRCVVIGHVAIDNAIIAC